MEEEDAHHGNIALAQRVYTSEESKEVSIGIRTAAVKKTMMMVVEIRAFFDPAEEASKPRRHRT